MNGDDSEADDGDFSLGGGSKKSKKRKASRQTGKTKSAGSSNGASRKKLRRAGGDDDDDLDDFLTDPYGGFGSKNAPRTSTKGRGTINYNEKNAYDSALDEEDEDSEDEDEDDDEEEDEEDGGGGRSRSRASAKVTQDEGDAVDGVFDHRRDPDRGTSGCAKRDLPC
jgi:hypothetical protein